MISRLSLRFILAINLLVITFVTEFPTITCKAQISQELLDDIIDIDYNYIRRQVIDGFTVTQEDKDFLENMNNDANSARLRIVAGEEASLGELPYQCAIEFRSGYSYCGGALIDPLHEQMPKYVITAAHCVKDRDAESLMVVCGVLKLSNTKPWNRFDVTAIHQHEYDSDSKVGDLAILQLKVSKDALQHRSDTSSNGMNAIELPKSWQSFSGVDCIVSGWGRTGYQGSTKPDILRKVDVLVPSQEKCNQMYAQVTDKFDKEVMICAGGDTHDACQGDSGGPIMCTVKGKEYLAGVVSWGIGCATEGVPGAYTNMAHYHSWIIETVTAIQKNIEKLN